MAGKSDTQKKKAAFLQAFEKNLGIVSTTCRSIGISRETFYDWKRKDEKFREAAEAVNEVAIDFVEGKLYGRINEGSDAAIIFYMKTRGRERGYVEKQEIEVTERKPLSWFATED